MRRAPNINVEPTNTLETTRARKLKFLKTPLDMVQYSLWVFLARWRPGGAGPPNIYFRPYSVPSYMYLQLATSEM